jgi:cytochrome c553
VNGERLVHWGNPWFRWSVGGVAAMAIASALVGFVWLPSVHRDFSARGLWDAICRAAGVPAAWDGAARTGRAATPSTLVIADPELQRAGSAEAVGRGATLALQCTMCHGARGLSASDAPNLAGQYPEVIYKQLRDYQAGQRRSPIMQALAQPLSERDMRDLSAYYAYLPRATLTQAIGAGAPAVPVPPLVRVGDPLRNIAPCATCHGGIDQKPGSPWLESMPEAYLLAQLQAFASGARRNDALGQMRAVARQMRPEEMQAVARYYASRPPGGP